MRFWDSSAVVPLLVKEKSSSLLASYASAGEPMYVWWGTRAEVAAAFARRERAGDVAANRWVSCRQALDDLGNTWRELSPSDQVRQFAERLLRRHPLRSNDGLQLAAALVACEDKPAGSEFVCLDERLRKAALAEGFKLLPP